MIRPEEVLSFWLDELQPSDWYNSSDELDGEIRRRFGASWTAAREGKLGLWLTYPSGALAYILLTDQLPRNMFRGEAQSFATDRNALAVAKCAVDKKWDMKIDEPARQFFYLPFMHSENLCDQERCVRLMLNRMPQTGASNLLHAKVHREIIRKFGRFPYRNEALSRNFTANERAYLDAGGYGSTMQDLQVVAV